MERDTPQEGTDPDRRCPVCGEGTLVDITFDRSDVTDRPMQTADAREVVAYSCGHEATGPSLGRADADELDVERRNGS